MKEAIDRKFTFCATSCEHGHESRSHMDAIIFVAKDKALPATLVYYREQCVRLGAMPEQIRGIDLLIERVNKFQSENADKVKVADVDVPDMANILAENEK